MGALVHQYTSALSARYHSRLTIDDREDACRDRNALSRRPVVEPESETVGLFGPNETRSKAKCLDRDIAFLPCGQWRVTVEDRMIQIADDVTLRIKNMSEAPIVAV